MPTNDVLRFTADLVLPSRNTHDVSEEDGSAMIVSVFNVRSQLIYS